MNDLLPPVLASDERMKAMGAVAQRLSEIDLSPLLVYMVDLVDASALPSLAEQFHVTGDEGWSLATDDGKRRDLIKAAIELHRFKGTPWAIKQALAKLGLLDVLLLERPQGAHWAEFDVEIPVTHLPLSAKTISNAVALIDEYKPVRSHLRRLILSLSARAGRQLRPFCLEVSEVTIFPQLRTVLTAHAAQAGRPLAVLETQSIEIYPR